MEFTASPSWAQEGTLPGQPGFSKEALFSGTALDSGGTARPIQVEVRTLQALLDLDTSKSFRILIEEV